jgi:hypothetical protein
MMEGSEMLRLRDRRIEFEMTLPLPGLSFIIRNRHGQAIASGLGVVVDQSPVTIPEPDNLSTKPGFGMSLSTTGLHVSPRSVD